MARVSVPRDRIADGTLPAVCVVCGADTPYRRFPGVSAPSHAWLLLSPLVGLIGFWVYILFAARDTDDAGLPFCDRHRNYWPRRAWFIVIGFVILVGSIVAAAALNPTPVAGQKREPHWLFGVVGCWMLVYLPAFIVLHLSSTRPTGGGRRTLVLSGVCKRFADMVEADDE